MSVDCIDSIDDSAEIFEFDEDVNCPQNIPLWNGRHVELFQEKSLRQALLAQFHTALQHQVENVEKAEQQSHHYELIDIEEEVWDEMDEEFDAYFDATFHFAIYHPVEQEFVLAEPNYLQAEILECKSLLKKLAKAAARTAAKVAKVARKCKKKTAKAVKHAAEDVADFVKDHKKEILITVAIAAAIVGSYYIAGALTAAAGSADGNKPVKRPEEDEGPSSQEPDAAAPPEDVPDSADPQPRGSEITDPTSLGSLIKTSADPKNQNSFSSLFDKFQGGKAESNPIPFFELLFKSDGHGTNPSDSSLSTLKSTQDLSFPPNLPGFSSTTSDAIHHGLASILQGPEPIPPQSPFDLLSKYSIESMKSNGPSLSSPPQLPATPTLPAPLKSAYFSFAQSLSQVSGILGPSVISLLSELPETALAPRGMRSRTYVTEGESKEGMRTTFINGIANSFNDAMASAEHLRLLGSNQCIHGIYNHSNTSGVDLIESLGFNLGGYSPKTQDLLIQQWTDFHEKNEGRPIAKCLHFCHSQGAIHTRNALLRLPKEIRERIIVVAIAPAVVVSDDLCYRSYNYASKKDIVHYGEDLAAHLQAYFGPEDEFQCLEVLEALRKSKDQLILLDPKGSTTLDDEFVSLTYEDKIVEHITEYNACNGEYK